MILRRYAELGSTNDEALRLAGEGAPHFTVVCAATQTAGRGRHGRHWVSPPGNLHASVLLRPDIPVERAPELGFVAAVAVAAALDDFVTGVTLKWPNDVLLQGAKLAGILTEWSDGAAIVGIGINVAHIPPEARYSTTCLALHAADVTIEAVLAALVQSLERELSTWQAHGFDSTRSAWSQRGPALGQALVARDGQASHQGGFAGLAEDGALLLDTPAGLRRVVTGDVH